MATNAHAIDIESLRDMICLAISHPIDIESLTGYNATQKFSGGNKSQ